MVVVLGGTELMPADNDFKTPYSQTVPLSAGPFDSRFENPIENGIDSSK